MGGTSLTYDGNGNLIKQVERLKELGARTNKGINSALLARAGAETEIE